MNTRINNLEARPETNSSPSNLKQSDASSSAHPVITTTHTRDDTLIRTQHIARSDNAAHTPHGREDKRERVTHETQNELDDTNGEHKPRRHDRRPRTDDITKKVTVEAPSFDGRHDPKAFSDWLSVIDDYFDWYDMRDERRIRFAKMKLSGPARIYWSSIVKDQEIR